MHHAGHGGGSESQCPPASPRALLTGAHARLTARAPPAWPPPWLPLPLIGGRETFSPKQPPLCGPLASASQSDPVSVSASAAPLPRPARCTGTGSTRDSETVYLSELIFPSEWPSAHGKLATQRGHDQSNVDSRRIPSGLLCGAHMDSGPFSSLGRDGAARHGAWSDQRMSTPTPAPFCTRTNSLGVTTAAAGSPASSPLVTCSIL